MPLIIFFASLPKNAFLTVALFFLVVIQNADAETSENPAEIIELPLRVHLIRGFEMENTDVTMGMWVTADDVRTQLLPEINRIWSAANIQWTIEGIYDHEVPESENRQELIEIIQNSDRSTSTKTFEIRRLRDPEIENHPVFHNLILFPFIGETRQGFASLGGSDADGGNYAYVGVWSNKSTGEGTPPAQVTFSEPLPFQKGSMGRTCAHELGHNLTLLHPDRDTQVVFNRVMGGRQHGYDFIEEEVELARSVARGRLATIANWVELNHQAPLELSEVNFDLADGTYDLSFQSNPGQTYQVEISENLETEDWENISQIIGAPNVSTTNVENLDLKGKETSNSLFLRVNTFGK